jgi:hypothetical protein
MLTKKLLVSYYKQNPTKFKQKFGEFDLETLDEEKKYSHSEIRRIGSVKLVPAGSEEVAEVVEEIIPKPKKAKAI